MPNSLLHRINFVAYLATRSRLKFSLIKELKELKRGQLSHFAGCRANHSSVFDFSLLFTTIYHWHLLSSCSLRSLVVHESRNEIKLTMSITSNLLKLLFIVLAALSIAGNYFDVYYLGNRTQSPPIPYLLPIIQWESLLFQPNPLTALLTWFLKSSYSIPDQRQGAELWEQAVRQGWPLATDNHCRAIHRQHQGSTVDANAPYRDG